MSERKKIDRIVLIEMDGKVTARCYTGANFVDAELTPSGLALLVADGARLLCAIQQRLVSIVEAKATSGS